jgi:cytochrome b561
LDVHGNNLCAGSPNFGVDAQEKDANVTLAGSHQLVVLHTSTGVTVPGMHMTRLCQGVCSPAFPEVPHDDFFAQAVHMEVARL